MYVRALYVYIYPEFPGIHIHVLENSRCTCTHVYMCLLNLPPFSTPVSQMDGDHFVSVSVIAGFSKVEQ